VCVETAHGEGSTADNGLRCIVVIFNISTATQARLKRRTADVISKTQLDLTIFADSYLFVLRQAHASVTLYVCGRPRSSGSPSVPVPLSRTWGSFH